MTSPARTPLSIGLVLPQRAALFGATTLPALLRLAEEGDRNQMIESIWVGDSLGAKPRPESLTLLGALASRTTGVRLGVACMASFPVRDPITFALQWATLDQLSSGRMLLAACTGIVREDRGSELEGRHWTVADSERPARLEENIVICRQLWSGSGDSYQGRFRSFQDLVLGVRPVQDPCPIWIASNPFPGRAYERAIRRVAAMADGWLTARAARGAIREAYDRLLEGLEAEGRDATWFRVAA
jgi:alkanesulfonate monooxygenase SsuD/methylene tetrahydromethanopterin reductase-like flavin-dependent oxidoreductase (luciferase family)